jgi:hypothetical protein
MPRFVFFLLSSALLLCSCNEASDSPSSTDPEVASPEQQQDPAAEQTEAASADEAAPAEVTGNVFGQPITLTETISSGELLAEPSKYEGKTLLVKGEVVDVCQKMGCWMVITDGEHSIRVTTKGHGFFVRKDGTGSVALVQGTLRHIAPNPERTAHLEGESAKPKAMPEKAGVEYEIDADGIVFTEAPKAG